MNKMIRITAMTTLALAFGYAVHAQTLTYNSRDLMLCFRKAQRNGGTKGLYDFEVNLGNVTNFINAAPGTTISLSAFTPAEVSAAFDNLNNASWSVLGASQTTSGGIPVDTLWVSYARSTDLNSPAPGAPGSRSASAQGPPKAEILSIGGNAQSYAAANPTDPLYNTPTAVRVQEGSGSDYNQFIGPNGNLSSTFWSDVENTTPSDFTTTNTVSRSDLYELRPVTSSAPGKWLGYFEFRPDGTAIFVSAGGTPPATPPPPVMALSRSNNTSTISFTTTNGFTYSLRYTNTAGLAAPVSSWAFRTNIASGNGSTQTVTDDTTDDNRVYRIEVH